MIDRSESLVTVFGGGGFIGRYVVQHLVKSGWRIRIAEREPKRAHFLQPLGWVGQFQFVPADIRKRESVERAVAGASAVINLVGILKGDFLGFHVDGARNVAEAAAAAGARSLVHVSAIGASPDSNSRYGRSKGEGEAAVRAAFPGATIVRPSVVFGPEDNFTNRFASMARRLPVLPVIGPNAQFQPVYVADLGRAISAAALDPEQHGGKTYELAGPHVVTMAELDRMICEVTGRAGKMMVPVPDGIAGMIASLTGWMPGAPITSDQWKMLQRPNVASGELPGFEAFGIRPEPLGALAETWLMPYRKGGRFAVKQPY
ncbi:MAG: complex I NDUFA9 subunit family protein [Allosphingosinicella sp.]|uniref:complex I NDUFA9 subunit family protein n=1 Tax=Allosphingosinicella sp. TaxID=2823234 RepID=UPI00392F2FE5